MAITDAILPVRLFLVLLGLVSVGIFRNAESLRQDPWNVPSPVEHAYNLGRVRDRPLEVEVLQSNLLVGFPSVGIQARRTSR
jgi:hypothetical protein